MTVSEVTALSRPVLSFNCQDLGVSVPHNDALVIHAIVANYEVAQVFIDTGSFINVLFYTVLGKMGIQVEDLQLVVTPLFGFSRHAIQPAGQIKLLVSLGEGIK